MVSQESGENQHMTSRRRGRAERHCLGFYQRGPGNQLNVVGPWGLDCWVEVVIYITEGLKDGV